MPEQALHSEPGKIPPRIAYLVTAYVRKSITPDEHDELDSWVEASDDNMRKFEELTNKKDTASDERDVKCIGFKKYTKVSKVLNMLTTRKLERILN